jgi:hypothetical protein
MLELAHVSGHDFADSKVAPTVTPIQFPKIVAITVLSSSTVTITI